jgi:hypothetical protein
MGRLTPVAPASPLIRETALIYRGRPLIVELHPKHLRIRLKGERGVVSAPLDYRSLYEMGIKINCPALWRKRRTL